MKEKTTIIIIQYLIVFALFITLIWAVSNNIKKSERAECVKWQGWQEQHKQFAPSKSMRDQCNYYQIKLK